MRISAADLTPADFAKKNRSTRVDVAPHASSTRFRRVRCPARAQNAKIGAADCPNSGRQPILTELDGANHFR